MNGYSRLEAKIDIPQELLPTRTEQEWHKSGVFVGSERGHSLEDIHESGWWSVHDLTSHSVVREVLFRTTLSVFRQVQVFS